MLSSSRPMVRSTLVAGTGGSGVTTLAAATAVAAAARGRRTLAYGLNAGLRVALDAEFASKPVKVSDSLWAIEGHQRRFQIVHMQRSIPELDCLAKSSEGSWSQMAALPGMN